MSNAVEIAKALASPAEKLLSLIGEAIGKVYEPVYIKRMADAKAYEIKTVGNAVSDMTDLPVAYDRGEISIDISSRDALFERASRRLKYQEALKQHNIEAVVVNAYMGMEDEQNASDETVDLDWLIRFFNSVEDISNPEMQQLWGALLVGEVLKPRSVSIRTLDVLRNMTQYEAELFSKISPYLLKCSGNDEKTYDDYFLLGGSLGNNSVLNKIGVDFSAITQLSEAGLLSNNSMITIGFRLASGEVEYVYGNSMKIELKNNGIEKIRFMHTAYILTSAGRELLPVVLRNARTESVNLDVYMQDCMLSMEKNAMYEPYGNKTVEYRLLPNGSE